jgi:hypothetical protein
MGENEELGWFPRYIGAQPICNNVPIIEYVGIDTSGNPIYKPKTSCGTIPKPSPTHAERMASLKSEMDAMAEKYKLIADGLVKEIYERSQKPIKPLIEETAQQISKAFEDIRKTMDKDFPMTFAKRKARKHYKPKFTL